MRHLESRSKWPSLKRPEEIRYYWHPLTTTKLVLQDFVICSKAYIRSLSLRKASLLLELQKVRLLWYKFVCSKIVNKASLSFESHSQWHLFLIWIVSFTWVFSMDFIHLCWCQKNTDEILLAMLLLSNGKYVLWLWVHMLVILPSTSMKKYRWTEITWHLLENINENCSVW